MLDCMHIPYMANVFVETSGVLQVNFNSNGALKPCIEVFQPWNHHLKHNALMSRKEIIVRGPVKENNPP